MSNSESPEPIEAVPSSASGSPPEASSDDAASESGSSAVKWIVAVLVAMGVSFFTTKMVTQSYKIPLPDQAYSRALAAADNDGDMEGVMLIEAQTAGQNAARLTACLAAALSVVLGLAAGLIHGAPVRGLIGAIVGGVVAFLLVVTMGYPVAELQMASKTNLDQRDMYGIFAHALQWAAIGVPVAVAVGLGAGSLAAGGKAFGAMLIGAALGAAIYVTAGGVLTPMENVADSYPIQGTPLLLWSLLPLLLAGLVLARSKP